MENPDLQLINKLKSNFEEVIKHTQKSFAGIRGNKVNTSIIEDLQVEVFGSIMPLKGLASISVTDNGQGFLITAWDKSSVNPIAKAISESDLNVNPIIDGNNLRIKFPPTTEEVRLKRVKMMKQKGEEGKISLRNHRHEVLDELKNLQKEKLVSEDQFKSIKEKIDKLTKEYESIIDNMMEEKEKDIMTV